MKRNVSRKASSSEADLVQACLAYARLRGAFVWRNNTGAARYQTTGGETRWIAYGKRGSADILGVLPGGRFIAIECKSATGRTTPEQQQFLADVRAAGGAAGIVRTLDDLKALMDGGEI